MKTEELMKIDARNLNRRAQWFFENSDQGALADLFGACNTLEDINNAANELYDQFADEPIPLDIREDIIEKYNLSLKELSERFGIPYRTVQNWAAKGSNHRECPDYVIKMMNEILSKEH